MIGERMIDGSPALTLATEDADGVEATFVPSADMVGCSLRHRGQELLGQRGGLRTYIAERSTMGIPLLHPWANRLARTRFSVAGNEVDLDDAMTLTRINGLPMRPPGRRRWMAGEPARGHGGRRGPRGELRLRGPPS